MKKNCNIRWYVPSALTQALSAPWRCFRRSGQQMLEYSVRQGCNKVGRAQKTFQKAERSFRVKKTQCTPHDMHAVMRINDMAALSLALVREMSILLLACVLHVVRSTIVFDNEK